MIPCRLSFLLLLSSACALPEPIESPGAVRKVSVGLYESRLSYDSSLKSRGDVQSAVASYAPGFTSRFDMFASSTHVDYSAGGTLEQADFAFAYNNISDWVPGSTFRIGTHVLHADDNSGNTLTDDGVTLFANWTRFEPLQWNLGCGLYATRFSGAGTDLLVLQLTPHFGTYLTDELAERSVYVETRGHAIHKNEEVFWGTNDLFSVEQRLVVGQGSFDLAMSGWLGEQLYAVAGDGFVIYSTPDRYKGGAGVELGFNPSSYQRLSLGFGFSRLEHPGTLESAGVTSLTLGLFTRF